MGTNLTGLDGEEMIKKTIDESGGRLDVLQVSTGLLSRYVGVLERHSEQLESVRVLVERDTLKDVMDDFLVASAVSDLVADGSLEVLSTEDTVERSLVVLDGESVVSFVDFEESVGALWSDDTDLVELSVSYFERAWDGGEEYRNRTPPMSDVRSTLREEIGEQTEEDFCGLLDALESARGDGDGLDEVTVALLAAARNKVLLYDISKWGEDSGVASKATFSRKKTELEDAGLLDTENVPIDIGRPRLRLKFADDSLHDASLEDVVAAALEATA